MSGFIKSLFSASAGSPTDGEADSPYSAFSALPPSGSSAKCANCGVRPRNTEPGVYDPSYCGPACAGEPDYGAASEVWDDGGNMCARPGCDEQIPPTAQFCSKEHAKAAVADGQVPGCESCHALPALAGKRWCSEACETRAAASPPPSKKPQVAPEPPPATDDKDGLIRQRFLKRWSDPVNRTTPNILKLQEISLRPQIQERWDRCTQTLEDRGGFNIKSTFYGGRCECNLASEDPRSNPCKSTTCRVCRVIRSAFAETAKAPAHIDEGDCGSGIYTKMNPADAHAHAHSPPGNDLRVIILCSVAVPKVPGDDNSEDPVVEENGRCYCPTKDNIIPRWVIVYGVNRPKPPPSPQVRKVSNAAFNPPASPSSLPASPRLGSPSGKDSGAAEKDRKIRQLEAKIKWLEQALKDEREKNKVLTNKLAATKVSAPPPAKQVDSLPDFPPSPPKNDSSKEPKRRRANSLPGAADGSLPDLPERRPTRRGEDDELPDLPDLPRAPKNRRARASVSTSDGFDGLPEKRKGRRNKRMSGFDDLPDNPPGAFPDDLPEFPPWDQTHGFGPGPGPFPPQPGFGWGPQPVPPPGWGQYGGFQPYGPPPPGPGQNAYGGSQMATCILKGCNKPVHEKGSKFCGDQHRKDAVTKDGMPACILCKEYPKAISQFCGQKCLTQAHAQAPMLINVDQKDPMFANIVHQFDTSWRHTNKTKPTVVFVYKIVQSKQLMDAYLAYQNKVESEGNFKSQGKSAGNECRRWHGTKRLCNIGDNPAAPTLCAQATCAMCSILRSSFQVVKTNTSGRSFNRFGKGIYTSSTSSKAFDYSSNGLASPYSMIMLTNVIVGQGHKLTQDSQALTAPPAGYHSVLGETGGSLNYDELVVYNDDAIRPSWLVVYQ